MVSNTEAFYTVAKKFQDQRADMVSKYTQKLNSMEPYRGSAGYENRPDGCAVYAGCSPDPGNY